MKTIKFIAIFSLTLFSFWGYTQWEDNGMDLGGFYEQMALSDAHMEETMRFTSQEDEADYWKDQLNFEKKLKEKEYSAYKIYIFYKRRAYQSHQAECDITVNHGKGYNRQALFYSAQGIPGENGPGDVSVDPKPNSLASKQN
ncbi:hypothetical protein SAMN06265375_101807 [Muriicola jejuensis]|uniref:Uncharacterized protein n=1 Tax=Muriicola jejuensis TaxID=504488 RepID=A0A6P0U9H3_9FLAO|nr:hypothetical protein [Muriicola jejuensis]NER09677.1 hypothetical protein [Muriicola jejuensis]SMP06689.1 hypothetical protein SAMN06265375_101807 [Muriicola jejuensis]